MTDVNKLADEHWSYVGAICERMYKDAFVHGYKHGREDASEGRGCEVNHFEGDDIATQEEIARWRIEDDDRAAEAGP